MENDLANDLPCDRFVLLVDGIAKSEHQIFGEAIKAGVQLKQQFPRSNVKLRGAHETAPSLSFY
jgi:hypothetical protein